MALSSLEHERLGWDDKMKLRLKTHATLTFSPSTDPRVRIEDFGSSAYDSQWAIFVPSSDGSEHGEWYLTVEALSLSRGEALEGRASLVWGAKVLKDDFSALLSNVSPMVNSKNSTKQCDRRYTW